MRVQRIVHGNPKRAESNKQTPVKIYVAQVWVRSGQVRVRSGSGQVRVRSGQVRVRSGLGQGQVRSGQDQMSCKEQMRR